MTEIKTTANAASTLIISGDMVIDTTIQNNNKRIAKNRKDGIKL